VRVDRGAAGAREPGELGHVAVERRADAGAPRVERADEVALPDVACPRDRGHAMAQDERKTFERCDRVGEPRPRAHRLQVAALGAVHARRPSARGQNPFVQGEDVREVACPLGGGGRPAVGVGLARGVARLGAGVEERDDDRGRRDQHHRSGAPRPARGVAASTRCTVTSTSGCPPRGSSNIGPPSRVDHLAANARSTVSTMRRARP
jgi:hypothetical protein